MIRRWFTINPDTNFIWGKRSAEVGSFKRTDLNFPTSWSDTAVNIVGQKYLTKYENGIDKTIKRVVTTIAHWGNESKYLDDEEVLVFIDELTYIISHQLATFNSPVWFNIGAINRKQQSSACFLLDVQDSMESILNNYLVEGMIFKGGSGSGINISKLRAKGEPISNGGTSSGPMSFMKGWDFSAGSIKSGGTTRRAAKMVIMNIDHPDVEEFIWCKVREEKKAQALMKQNFSTGMEGDAYTTVAYQNANNSIMLTDAFMRAVERDADWDLLNRTDGRIAKTIKARALFNQIAQAAWDCGDPGLLFFDTIQKWHSHPNHSPVIVGNPCGEFLFCINSSCNLSCINIRKLFARENPYNDLTQIINTLTVAQEILVERSQYPTDEIRIATRRCRPIAIGITDLGGYLMSHGVAYDSQEARDFGARVFSYITATACIQSANISMRVGPSQGWKDNEESWLEVLLQHKDAAPETTKALWANVVDTAKKYGLRNGQVTNQMPTGTVSFMLDAVTTGIEPEVALTKTKTLIGGGYITTINPLIKEGLHSLGYSTSDIEAYAVYLTKLGTLEGSGLPDEHIKVFDCAFDDKAGRAISWKGHVDMMAALQPHIDSGISKTVNLPSFATVEDIQDCYMYAWKHGVKALAVYRDGSKGVQPINTGLNPSFTGKIEVRCSTCGAKDFIPAGACMVCTTCGTQGGCG